MITLRRSLLGIALVFFSACTDPGEKTAIGAAAGGALGAGLGAIVGNQTGSTGSGMAIGAVAGASAGALVANSFEASDKRLDAQDEALKRNEALARSQKREIGELRRVDQAMPSSATTSWATSGSTWDRRSGMGVKHASPSDIAAARARLRSGGTVGRTAMIHPTQTTPSVAPLGSLPPKPSFQPSSSTSTVKEKSLVEESLPSAGTDITSAAAIAPAAVEAKVVAAAQPVKAIEESGTTPSDCIAADKELAKSATVTDSSDKLFHVRRALRMCPENPTLHNKAGELYRSLSRHDDAKYEFQEALKLDPGLAAAKNNLAMLNNGTTGSRADNGRY